MAMLTEQIWRCGTTFCVPNPGLKTHFSVEQLVKGIGTHLRTLTFLGGLS
jgi:hypothetical protein